MRFKRGSRVEVLDKREMPSGSWWCGEIISGNGHYYSIKYDCHSDDTGVTVEKVPRNVIRPCPPPILRPSCWVPGDIVEVYDKNSWKVTEVSRIDREKYFYVRFLGSSRKLRVHLSYLRARQVWEDDNWIVIQKKSGECIANSQSQARDFSNQPPHSCVEAKTCRGDDRFPNKYDGDFDDRGWVPTGSKKRKPIVTYSGACKKMRSIEETGRHCRLFVTPSSHLLEKVDAGASSHTINGAKYVHASLNYRTRRCETEMDELNPDFVEYLESSDAKSTCSSVGSCSAGSGPYKSLHYPIVSQTQGMDSHYDDTASSHESGSEHSLPAKEGSPEEIHCLEVNAYRSTLVALYASGSLSWEQETLLTNLRLMLHISNDEHLFELKNLISAGNIYSS